MWFIQLLAIPLIAKNTTAGECEKIRPGEKSVIVDINQAFFGTFFST